jgi:hypothetical protein
MEERKKVSVDDWLTTALTPLRVPGAEVILQWVTASVVVCADHGGDDYLRRGLINACELEKNEMAQRCHLAQAVSLALPDPRQQNEAHEITERVGKRQDLGHHATLGTADGLVLSPPFAPWRWRWTLTIVASSAVRLSPVVSTIESPRHQARRASPLSAAPLGAE